MNINELTNIDSRGNDKITGKAIGHEENMHRIIAVLGYENVKRCIPFSLAEIKAALPRDRYLNNLSISKWRNASGVYVNDCSGTTRIFYTPLVGLYRAHGINCFSQSDGVSILKECARLWAEEVTA